MDMANGDVFTYCFLKHFLTFLLLPEREQHAQSQGSWNDTAILEQLVQKCAEEEPTHPLHSSRGSRTGIFIQHWNTRAQSCSLRLSLTSGLPWEHRGMSELLGRLGHEKLLLASAPWAAEPSAAALTGEVWG